METVYFVDFDNTISRQDVWDTIVREFAPEGWNQHVRAYIRGEINSRECNRRLATMIPPQEARARELVLAIGIDPTFHDFIAWTRARQSPVTILSDGYNYYIDLLLQAERLESVPYYSNQLTWTATGVQVAFPLTREDCRQGMAHCKCQHLENLADKRRVYIGDGISDTCAAQRCEQVYAKHDLLKYCKQNAVAYVPFSDFRDIIQKEEELLAAVELSASEAKD